MLKNSIAAIMIICLTLAAFAGCSAAGPASAVVQVLPSNAAPAATTTATQQPTPTITPTPTATVLPTQSATGYRVVVPYDLKTEQDSQKSVDAGHSPWRLDAAFVAQVFVSLKISPEGIVGDYPIPYEDFKVTQSTDTDAVVEVAGDKTPISTVYLKRLVRPGEGGIWTVVGYDPKN